MDRLLTTIATHPNSFHKPAPQEQDDRQSNDQNSAPQELRPPVYV